MIRKNVKFLLISISVLVGFALVFVIIFYFKTQPTFLDEPSQLSGKTETIEVYYVAWACDCAEWIETRFEKADSNYETKAEDCIFLKAVDKNSEIPESFYLNYHQKKIQLVGQFYVDKGIPASYRMKTEEKPDKAKVFLYEKFKIIDLAD